MKRILIVEDDPAVSALIEATLDLGGYEHLSAATGNDALFRIQTEQFDLILLDVMLPGLDGFSLLQKIRGREIPVIFLTARDKVEDRVRGLKMGAEDYITKPFEPQELLARMEVVLRRYHRPERILTFDDIVVNEMEHTVTQAGQEVQLTPKEYELLVLLMQHPDEVLSRDRILQAVWGYSYGGESRTVDMHIMQLRRKLDFRGKLKAVVKVGYRLQS